MEDYSKYTLEANNVLNLAKEEALIHKHKFIEPEYLLLGLLDESNGLAAYIIKSFDVAFDTVRNAIKSSLLQEEKSALQDDFGLSSRSKKVIELAVEEVALLKHDYLGTEHLLLGLMREENSNAVTVLSSFGITLDQILTRIIQVHTTPDTAHVPEIERLKPTFLIIDAERQSRIKKYIFAAHLASSFYVLLLFIAGLYLFSVFFDETIRILTQIASTISNSSLLSLQIGNWYPLQLLAYFTIITVCYLIIVLPYRYFVYYLLPYYFKIRGGTLKHWFISFFKSRSLQLMNWYLFLEVIYLFLVFQPETWWIWVVIVHFLYAIGMIILFPIVIFPYFYSYKITPILQDAIVEQLAVLNNRAHAQMLGIFKMENVSKHSNLSAAAYLMGWGKTRRIVVTQSILDRFPLEEIEVIIGHELGHRVRHDIWKRLISSSLLLSGVLFAFNSSIHPVNNSPSAVGFEGHWLLLDPIP